MVSPILANLEGCQDRVLGGRFRDMAHARRKFFDLHMTNQSRVAAEALRGIAELYEIKGRGRGTRHKTSATTARSKNRTQVAIAVRRCCRFANALGRQGQCRTIVYEG
ncbi:transposase [Pseudomonas brassicacearum subsp. brassicacearum]|nr:transposase [Pseudomonas brassicacearum subsp. brassicacearum]